MAAKRASIVAASNAKIGNVPSSDPRTSLVLSQNGLQTPQLSTQPSKSSIASKSNIATQARSNAPRQSAVDSSSDSEDDAPLATLVAPKRPGSAMSSYSYQHSRSSGNVTTRSATNMPPKPLIDINELTAPKRSYTSPLEKNTAGFTEGPTLLSQAQRKMTQPAYQPSRLVESPVSVHQQLPWQANGSVALDRELLTTTVAPVKFTTPMTSPAKEKHEFISKTELDAHMSTANGAANQDISSLRRDSSPEMRRDPITDRLTRAVKNTLQATSPSLGATAPPPSSAVGSQRAASPTPRAMSPNSGSTSETSTSRRTNGNAPSVLQLLSLSHVSRIQRCRSQRQVESRCQSARRRACAAARHCCAVSLWG
ncbi:hypothetical protein BJ912DRAFT_215410 [Pholiota molesta]|nr:hypothetical protein BJ912DRAFT_215410 [Pholiota molesta]